MTQENPVTDAEKIAALTSALVSMVVVFCPYNEPNHDPSVIRRDIHIKSAKALALVGLHDRSDYWNHQ